MNGAYVLIDPAALARNAKALKARLGSFYCVLKCDAYGHGAEKCAAQLADIGMERFAVYSLSEANTVRKAAKNAEILILGRTEPVFCDELEAGGFVQTVSSADYARVLAYHSKNIKIHIEIDCGMNRSGFKPLELSAFSLPFPAEKISGVFGHLSCADEKELSEAEKQIRIFESAAGLLEKTLGKPLIRHLSASAASLRSELKTNALSRIGLALYGVAPENCDGGFLEPVMSFYSDVTEVRSVKKSETVGYGSDHSLSRDSVIATVSGGYANGILRSASTKLTVLIHGQPAPSVGRICMDRFMVDVTDVVTSGTLVRPGDTVTFFDKNFGIESMARACGTIPYEVLTCIGNSNRRIYADFIHDR
ncbi:MAG: alanine racemase [Ruminococcaceae bacterium]|nr:alanine racemase [Oscillospiraceae bacterium]